MLPAQPHLSGRNSLAESCPPAFHAGQILAHYEIEDILGRGWWGDVYRARDLRLERNVALKVPSPRVPPGDPGWGRALKEARLAAQLSHPNICTVFEAGEDAGFPYIAMEYVDGLPLQELIGDSGLETSKVLHYASQLARALSCAHARGIVHGDIKASNVLIAADNSVKLVDFGASHGSPLARGALASPSPGSPTPESAATLVYAAPEILEGNPASEATDLWALGVLLYEMTMGRLPFSGEAASDISVAILTAQFPPLPAEVPSGLHRVIGTCLQRSAEKRFPTAERLLKALEDAQAGDTEPRKGPKFAVKRPILWFAGTLAVLLAGLLLLPAAQNWRSRLMPQQNTRRSQRPPAAQRPRQENPATVVWVNKPSGVYHCPGSRWFGKTKSGLFMTQAEARQRGYTPALGKVCE